MTDQHDNNHDQHDYDPRPGTGCAHDPHACAETARGATTMNLTAVEGPRLNLDDVVGGAQQRNDVEVLHERNGVPVRYRLHVDARIEQSYFVVEAYDPAGRQWNDLWAIPQQTYTFDGPEGADTNPDTRVLASPYQRDLYRKSRSWQKIMDRLTAHADYLLAPRATAGGCACCADTPGETAGNGDAGPI